MSEQEESGADQVKTKKSLVTKLSEACNSVGGIEKKGRNEHQKYNYVKAADVAKALRRELFSRQIIVLADEKELNQTGSIRTQSGGEMRELTLRVDYHILDGESPEKITVSAFGVAMDTGDKAVFKAKTGALKYFLRGLGLIPDEKDDPEADEEVDKILKAEPSPEQQAKMESQQRIGQFQVKGITDACGRSKKTTIEQSEYLGKLNLKQWEELQKHQFNDALKWANGAKPKPLEVNPVEMKRIFATAAERGIPEQDVKTYAYQTHKVSSMTALAKPQLQEVLEWVQTI